MTNTTRRIQVPFLLLAAASVANAQAMRKDLADLARQIALVREMYPAIPASASIRASLGVLEDSEESPRIELSLQKPAGRARIVEKVGVVLDPEEQLYSGAAAFDRVGRLDAYSGKTREATARFAELDQRLGASGFDEAKLSSALGELGAPFAAIAPTIETCRPLRVLANALGSAELIEPATRIRLEGNASTVKQLGRYQLSWSLRLSAKRGDAVVIYWTAVDPWGEIVAIWRDGRPLP